jgi:hypothetical protein
MSCYEYWQECILLENIKEGISQMNHCTICGRSEIECDLTYAPDPYLKEMFNDEVDVYMCDECRSDRRMSV